MSIKNKCQSKTNVNQKQLSIKNKCQPKTNRGGHGQGGATQ